MDRALLGTLPPVQRLALAYAPARARPAWLALLALDTRLALQLRGAREPMLAQIKLAWWRERLSEPETRWPGGEPVLAALLAWRGQHGALVALVDGWEALLGDAPLGPDSLETFVDGRAAAMAALAAVLAGALGRSDAAAEARRAGAGWAIADLAAHLSHPEERALGMARADRHDWRRPRLPRVLRPLAVLQGLAVRELRNPGNSSILLALRLGIFGF